MGDIKSPDHASSHQPVREREGLDMEIKERARVLRAIIILFNSISICKTEWQMFKDMSGHI